MKKNLFSSAIMAAIVLSGAVLISCSGSGSSSDVATDGMFGEMPALMADLGDQSVDLYKKLINSSSKEEMESLMTNKKEELEKTANEAINAAVEKMKDKEFPVEVSSNVPIKLTSPIKIDAENTKEETICFKATAENLETVNWGYGDHYNIESTMVVLVDKDGVPVGKVSEEKYRATEEVDGNEYKPGTKAEFRFKIKFTPWNALLLSKSEKFLIINSDADSEIKKQARDTIRSAEREYNNKMGELLKQLMEKAKEYKN